MDMTTPVFAAQPYSGIASFGRVPIARSAEGYDVSIVGVPYDGSVSYRSGARFGPRAIREQSLLLWGYNNAQKIAPFKVLKVADLGDLDVIPPDIVATHHEIEQGASRILMAGSMLMLIHNSNMNIIDETSNARCPCCHLSSRHKTLTCLPQLEAW